MSQSEPHIPTPSSVDLFDDTPIMFADVGVEVPMQVHVFPPKVLKSGIVDSAPEIKGKLAKKSTRRDDMDRWKPQSQFPRPTPQPPVESFGGRTDQQKSRRNRRNQKNKSNRLIRDYLNHPTNSRHHYQGFKSTSLNTNIRTSLIEFQDFLKKIQH